MSPTSTVQEQAHVLVCRLRMTALARPSQIDILPLTTPPPKIGADLVSAF